MTNRQELHATVDHMWDFCGRTGRLVVVRWTGFEKLDDAMAHNCDCETTKIMIFKFVSTEKRSAGANYPYERTCSVGVSVDLSLDASQNWVEFFVRLHGTRYVLNLFAI